MSNKQLSYLRQTPQSRSTIDTTQIGYKLISTSETLIVQKRQGVQSIDTIVAERHYQT